MVSTWHRACGRRVVFGTRSDPVLPREVPLGDLLQRVAERGTALWEAQIGMARAELARDLEVQVRRFRVVAAAMLLVLCGLQLLVVSLVLALATRLDAWLATLLVSAPLLIAGTTILLKAHSRVGAPFLEKTFEAVKEDLRWFKDLWR